MMSAVVSWTLFVERLGWVLVHSVWQLALIALFAAFVTRLMRRSSAATRYLMLVSMLAAVALVPAVTWCLIGAGSTSGAPPRSAANRELIGDEPLRPVIDTDPLVGRVVDVAAAGTHSQPASLPTAADGGLAESLASRVRSLVRPWLRLIVTCWLSGAALFGLRPLVSCWTIWRFRHVGVSAVSAAVAAAFERARTRMGVGAAVSVLESSRAQVPMVIGYLRPAVLLPIVSPVACR